MLLFIATSHKDRFRSFGNKVLDFSNRILVLLGKVILKIYFWIIQHTQQRPMFLAFNDIFHENTKTFFNVVHHYFNSRLKKAVLLHNMIFYFYICYLKVTYAVIIIPTHVRNINIKIEWYFSFIKFVHLFVFYNHCKVIHS